MVRWLRRLVLVLLGVGVVVYLLTGVAEVRPGERLVVRRFGRVLPETPGPGLWIGLPWGMDRVDRVSVDSLRRVEVGYVPGLDDESSNTPPGQLLTGDHNLVNVQVVLAYTVREAEVADYVLQQDRVNGLVARAAEGALAEWVGSRGVDEVLLHGRNALRPWLVEQTQRRLDGRADRDEPYHLGVQVQQADVAYLYPPREVKGEFDRVTQAQTEIQTVVNKAEEAAANRRRQALSEKYRTLQMAEAYAHEQRARAEAEAANFTRRLEQYRALRQQNPDFLKRVWLDEVGRLLAQLRAGGRLDLLDDHLSADGLDITVLQPPAKKQETLPPGGRPGP